MTPGDRISELYKGLANDSFSPEAQAVAPQRIHWMCQRAEGQKVVDIGCSQGIVSILLAREGFEVVGVDTNVEAIEYANSDRAKEPPEVQQRLTFTRGNIYDIDLPAYEFHTAIMGEFLEHQVRPDKAIRKAHELLVDNGKLIITTPFGLLKDPDHKQTFYVASLYKLIYPYFVIREVEIIGRYLCLLCERREAVPEKQMDSLDLALVERAEREFLHRETALTTERDARNKQAEKFKAELDSTKAELNTIKTELNNTKGEINSIESELDASEAQLDITKGELRTKAELDTTKAELNTIKTELNNTKAELNTTKAELVRETTRLRAELAKEQRTVQAVRASFSFRLGHALVRPIRKPGRVVILLSYRLLKKSPDGLKKVILKVANKSKTLTFLKSFAETATLSSAQQKQLHTVLPKSKTPGLSTKKARVLEAVKDRINEIKQEMGDAATYAVEPRRKDLKIAVIMDEIFYELFKYEANLITFTPDNWKQVLSEDRPDLLLVDSAWHGNNDTWIFQIHNLKQRLQSKLPELVPWCKTQNIPTAFWNREDSLHYEEFVDAARLFDYVFTTDADCIERYKKDLGHSNIFCLPFAAQPRIHNPVGSTRKIRDVAFAGSWYAVGHDDRIKLMEYVLKPVLAYDVDIFDRNYSRNITDLTFPKEYQPNIVGELGYNEMVYAYKMYKLFLNINSISESPTMFAMRVPEILASGTCILSSYSKGIENLIGSDIVKMTSSPEKTKLYLEELLENKELRDRLAHLGLRKVMKEHTYEKRLDYILNTMGIAKGKSGAKERGVSIIISTNKLEYMDNIFANYDRQEYEDKELIIILNNDRLNLGEWREKVKSHPDVTVYQIDEKETLGVCLNYGIEKAKFNYISKFDDDNYYGPAFLEDLMNAFEYTDADIVGKCAGYIYFENGDILALYGEAREHCYTHFVLGSAIIIKREVFDRVPWPTDRIWGSDTEFLRQSVKNGFKIYSADRFNYVYVRRSSQENHTWKVKDEEQLALCRIICNTKDYALYVTC